MLKSLQLVGNKRKKRRALHVRNRLRREASAPRLSVHRTSKHISVQVIDDDIADLVVLCGDNPSAFQDECTAAGTAVTTQSACDALPGCAWSAQAGTNAGRCLFENDFIRKLQYPHRDTGNPVATGTGTGHNTY